MMLKVTEWHWRFRLVCPHIQVPPEFIVFAFLPASTQLKMDLELSSVLPPSLSSTFYPPPPIRHGLTPLYLRLFSFCCVTLFSFSCFFFFPLSSAELFLFIPALCSFSLSSLHQPPSHFSLCSGLSIHSTFTIPSIPCHHVYILQRMIFLLSIAMQGEKGGGQKNKDNERKNGKKKATTWLEFWGKDNVACCREGNHPRSTYHRTHYYKELSLIPHPPTLKAVCSIALLL